MDYLSFYPFLILKEAGTLYGQPSLNQKGKRPKVHQHRNYPSSNQCSGDNFFSSEILIHYFILQVCKSTALRLWFPHFVWAITGGPYFAFQFPLGSIWPRCLFQGLMIKRIRSVPIGGYYFNKYFPTHRTTHRCFSNIEKSDLHF